MAKVLFDTDVLIAHLIGPPVLTDEFAGSSYSSISRAELYSGKNVDEEMVDRLLGQFDEITIDRAIAEEAGRIRRVHRIKLPDALIAATAITAKRPLFTRNKKDFKRVERLRLY